MEGGGGFRSSSLLSLWWGRRCSRHPPSAHRLVQKGYSVTGEGLRSARSAGAGGNKGCVSRGTED